MTWEEMVLGVKRLGYGGETTSVEKRGETTRGEMSWGVEPHGTHIYIVHVSSEPTEVQIKAVYIGPIWYM